MAKMNTGASNNAGAAAETSAEAAAQSADNAGSGDANLQNSAEIQGDNDSDKTKSSGVQTLPMTRDEPQHEGGPTIADVHIDEVNTWIAHGWRCQE